MVALRNDGPGAALDHVFVMAPPGGGRLLTQLAELGLVETYRRSHPGQGTANACFAFGNAFLEVLWIEDVHQTRSPDITRCRFENRALGQRDHPIGIAWRGPLAVDTWSFRPPYLPANGEGIQVAADSDRIGMPMLFTFPGTTAPVEWAPSRQGGLQTAAGLDRLAIEVLHLQVEASPTIQQLCDEGVIEDIAPGPPSVSLRLEGPHRSERLQLPGHTN